VNKFYKVVSNLFGTTFFFFRDIIFRNNNRTQRFVFRKCEPMESSMFHSGTDEPFNSLDFTARSNGIPGTSLNSFFLTSGIISLFLSHPAAHHIRIFQMLRHVPLLLLCLRHTISPMSFLLQELF